MLYIYIYIYIYMMLTKKVLLHQLKRIRLLFNMLRPRRHQSIPTQKTIRSQSNTCLRIIPFMPRSIVIQIPCQHLDHSCRNCTCILIITILIQSKRKHCIRIHPYRSFPIRIRFDFIYIVVPVSKLK